MEIIKSEKQKEKGLKKSEDSLRDTWDTISRLTYTVGVPEEKSRKG